MGGAERCEAEGLCNLIHGQPQEKKYNVKLKKRAECSNSALFYIYAYYLITLTLIMLSRALIASIASTETSVSVSSIV